MRSNNNKRTRLQIDIPIQRNLIFSISNDFDFWDMGMGRPPSRREVVMQCDFASRSVHFKSDQIRLYTFNLLQYEVPGAYSFAKRGKRDLNIDLDERK